MSRIFISYKRVDKDKVFKIKDQIESALGEKCWIDLDGIESDAQFKNVIIKAINESEIVLFMYSKTHARIIDYETDWTIRELNFAQKKKKRLVFINIDNSKLTDTFLFEYGVKQQVDGTSYESIKRLIEDLYKWKITNKKQTNITPKRLVLRNNIHSNKKTIISLGALFISLTILVVVIYNTRKFTKLNEEKHEYVDLALPSGTLWATCNIGADKPEQFGNYFAWGEIDIQQNNAYAWSSYKWCKGSETTLTKYSTDIDFGLKDDILELQEEDDVATKLWGKYWRMPKISHFEELLDTTNTHWEWIDYNGSYGYMFYSKRNNNKIFFPAAGYWVNGTFNGTLYDGYEGNYWSSSLIEVGSSMASSLNMDSTSVGTFTGTFRHCGFSVRAIRQ